MFAQHDVEQRRIVKNTQDLKTVREEPRNIILGHVEGTTDILFLGQDAPGGIRD